jgi:hypothetical protein
VIILAAAVCLLLGLILFTVGLLKKIPALRMLGIASLCAAPILVLVLILGFRNFG